MKEQIREIIEKVAIIRGDEKKGAKLTPPFAGFIDNIEFLLSELHEKNERIRKLEKIIIEDRIAKID